MLGSVILAFLAASALGIAFVAVLVLVSAAATPVTLRLSVRRSKSGHPVQFGRCGFCGQPTGEFDQFGECSCYKEPSDDGCAPKT